MKQSQQRFVSLASLLLVAGAAFAACGGPDSRKVTRGPDEPTAATSNKGGEGTSPSGGGSDSLGGDTGNPFGGNLFEGGAPPVIDGPPEVVNVDPKDAADDAEPAGAISLLFSEGLDPATVTSANIKIMDGAVEVGGELSYEGVVSQFDPTRRLSLLAPYDVSVSQAVTDIGGTPLKAAFASKFRVRDGVWNKQSSAFDATGNLWTGYQDVAIDERGNALVVYTRRPAVNMRSAVIARWYRASGGWQDEVPLDDSNWDCSGAKVAVDPNGDAVVAWFGNDPQYTYRTFARRYVAGAWEAQALDLVNQDTSVFNSGPPPLSVAIGGGQVVVAWMRIEYVPTPFTLVYSFYVTGTSIDAAWPDYPYAGYSAVYDEALVNPVATVDSKGNAIAMFGYYSSNMDPNYGAGTYYTRKAATGSWQYPKKITGSTRPDYGPVLAGDGDGAMAMWETYDSITQKYHVYASRYTKAKQFVQAVDIGDPDLTDYIQFQGNNLVGNSKGYFAAWTQAVGNSRNAYVNHYDVATSMWDALPTPVSDGVSNAGGTISVGLDLHGNALVAFNQEGPNYTYLIMWSRLPAGGSWSEPALLSAEDGLSYDSPFLAVAGNGIAAALFMGGGSRGIEQQQGGELLPGQFRFFD